MVVDINSSKKSILENNQRLDQKLKDAVEEINRLNNIINKYNKNENRDNKLIKRLGFNNVIEVDEFITKYKNHNCMDDNDRVQYEIVKGNNDKNFYKIKDMENKIELLKKEIIKKDDSITILTDKYINHKCIFSGPAIEENKKYKEMVMSADIGKVNEIKRLRLENVKNIDIIKQDTQNEKIVDEVLETDIKNNNRETIIVDDIVEEVLESNINKDIISDINLEIETDIKKDDKNIIIPKVNKTKDIIDEDDYGCRINIYMENINDTRTEASKKLFINLEHYYNIFIKSEKDKNDNFDALDDAAIYILNTRKSTINRSNRDKWRNIVKKSYEVYNKYLDNIDKLKLIDFSLTNMAKIRNKQKWEKWLKYLDKKINEIKEIDNVSFKRDGFKNKEDITSEDKSLKLNSNIEEPSIDNKFNYNYILNNKKGFLFKENDKLYTYNFYEEKREADIPDGDCCNKCGYTRFTTSGCCIYRDCENRKFGNTEFEIYEDRNKKRCPSKYNKKKYISEKEDYEIDEDIFRLII